MQQVARVAQAPSLLHMFQDEVFLLQCALPCNATLDQQVVQLQGIRGVVERVNQGQRVFAFIEVFAEAFLCGILGRVRYIVVNWQRRGTYIRRIEVLVVISDLEVSSEETT